MNSRILTIHTIYSCVLNEIKYFLGSSVFSFVIAGYCSDLQSRKWRQSVWPLYDWPQEVLRGPRVVRSQKSTSSSTSQTAFLSCFPATDLASPLPPTDPPLPQPHSLLLSCSGDLSPGQRKGGKRGKVALQSPCPPVTAHRALSSLPGLLQESSQAPPASALASCLPVQPPPCRNRNQAVLLPCERTLWCFFTVLRM